ncbi:hypothetical protein QR98_0057380 [Sarcoptes scabiei]|uniref:Protein zer-1 homolog-like C-terminal domain-containing protein n=1 Tax=Sarcoptes scabiei TaxID=52283 RepID=A0A132A8Q5_SARSC|nr:hypothetical protein QR98_0057380 [Sarcoptes scabiei]
MNLIDSNHKMFEGNSYIETKILGLLNNIAEVSNLRAHLTNAKLLNKLKKLAFSDQTSVSYFAIGIFAQLASDETIDWDSVDDFEFDFAHTMCNQIRSWPNTSSEMVSYRSFEPLGLLLFNSRYKFISMWSLWAIHHVCKKNRKFFQQNLIL